jgi:hypothetical protein
MKTAPTLALSTLPPTTSTLVAEPRRHGRGPKKSLSLVVVLAPATAKRRIDFIEHLAFHDPEARTHEVAEKVVDLSSAPPAQLRWIDAEAVRR